MFPAKKTDRKYLDTVTEIAPMNRRPLVIFALVIASMVASACASITAPNTKGDDPCSGFIDSAGRCIGG